MYDKKQALEKSTALLILSHSVWLLNPLYYYFHSVRVCVCVWCVLSVCTHACRCVCPFRHIHMETRDWQPDVFFKCISRFGFCCLFWDRVSQWTCNSVLARLVSKSLGVFTSHTWAIDAKTPALFLFIWGLGIWTQILMLAQQAPHPLISPAHHTQSLLLPCPSVCLLIYI